MQEGYHGGGKPKKMTRKQVQEMVNNMKKTEIISERSKQYHEKEVIEAEDILKKLNKNN